MHDPGLVRVQAQPERGRFQNLKVFERTEDGWRCLSWFNRCYEGRE
jgi:hypothetical protein